MQLGSFGLVGCVRLCMMQQTESVQHRCTTTAIWFIKILKLHSRTLCTVSGFVPSYNAFFPFIF